MESFRLETSLLSAFAERYIFQALKLRRDCLAEVDHYFRTSFAGAYDRGSQSKTKQTIIFRFHAESPKSDADELWLPFTVESTAIVTTLDAPTLKDWTPEWRDEIQMLRRK